ncbi:hypothetical protein E5288_WYG019259 [Bos mutus]|uniref:Uncharacterized protein n=1 Tax=Bos mutus TaxID=72004 RepID=A0A6B0S8H6_9CETA|nr:hypothetical protein [Bos mutus]
MPREDGMERMVQNRFHRESQPQSGESFRLGSEGLAWGRPLSLTASNTEKDNKTFHSVRKGVVSKGTQGYRADKIKTTALSPSCHP